MNPPQQHTDGEPSRPPFPFPYRVFGIGMNKTGTSSLRRAAVTLGIRPVATVNLVYNAGLVPRLVRDGDLEPALRFASIYRFFEDRPWNMGDLYKRLDERYPGSRFILTRRDPESWWKSVHRWVTVSKPDALEIYQSHLGVQSLDKAAMIEAYLRYNAGVLAYFAGRPHFLAVDFEAGDRWEPLCRFLDLPVPTEPFPHANRQAYDASDGLRPEQRARKKANKHLHSSGHASTQDELLNLSPACGSCGRPVHLRKGTSTNPPSTGVPMPWRARLHQQLELGRLSHPLARVGRLWHARLRHRRLRIDDMAVVTTFFNPCASRRRLENYRAFHRRIGRCGLPLLTVELAFGNDPHQLGPGDGERIQLRSPHVMWQKERLLNLGITELLRRGFRKIVWLDADVFFEDAERWPWQVAACLEKHSLCQVFTHALAGTTLGQPPEAGLSAVHYATRFGIWLSQPSYPPARKRPFLVPKGFSGLGWAARAEVLRQVPLYDRAIIGGGDKLMFYASEAGSDGWTGVMRKMLGGHTLPCETCGHTNHAPALVDDYLAWAARWHTALGGSMPGCAPLLLHSLPHGKLSNRYYQGRHEILHRHAFDPASDLRTNADGCWEWNSPKPLLHHQVQAYFFARQEDHES